MYITTDTIITAATLIGALGVIGGTIVAIYKFYQKPAKLEKKLENLQKTHDEDIRKINEEQCLATYGLLACLKGLKEQGCNGPAPGDSFPGDSLIPDNRRDWTDLLWHRTWVSH